MPVTSKEVETARRNLVAWLRYHQRSTGLDQVGLAKALGVTKGLITQWYQGEGTDGLPSFTSLLAISKELDTPLDILFRRGPPGESSPPSK